jgi:transposase
MQQNKIYKPEILENGDTEKQLLARSRYLLFKSVEKWTEKQKNRAKILFEKYPDIKKVYGLTQSLRQIFSKTKLKKVAFTKLAQWYNKVELSGFKRFNAIKSTIQAQHMYLELFDDRSTNAVRITRFGCVRRCKSEKVDYVLYFKS